MDTLAIKTAITAVCGVAAAFVEPVLPVAGLCTVAVVADVVSALRLRRRLKRAGKSVDTGMLSSRRFGRAVRTLAAIYVGLCAAHGVDMVLGGALCFVTGGYSALNFLGAMILVWQLMSVLENESTCSGSRWAARARKYLADKTMRHLEK